LLSEFATIFANYIWQSYFSVWLYGVAV
jgi:hypothetical protein